MIAILKAIDAATINLALAQTAVDLMRCKAEIARLRKMVAAHGI